MPSHALREDAGDAGGASCTQTHTRPIHCPAVSRGQGFSQPSKGSIAARIMEQVRRFDAKALPNLKKQRSGPIPSKVYVPKDDEEENTRSRRIATGKEDRRHRSTGSMDHYLVELQSERVGSLAIHSRVFEDAEPSDRTAGQELWSRESQLTLLVAHCQVDDNDNFGQMHCRGRSQRKPPTVIADRGKSPSPTPLFRNKPATSSSQSLIEESHESSFENSVGDDFFFEDPQAQCGASDAGGEDASSSLDTFAEEDEVHVIRPWMESAEGQVIRPWIGRPDEHTAYIETIECVQSPQAQSFSPRATSILLQGTSELTLSNSSHSSSDPGPRFDCIGFLHNGFRSCALPVSGECVGRRKSVDTVSSED
jgi:hypothetical protein